MVMLLGLGLLLLAGIWLAEPALAYVDPTAAGQAVQSIYLAAMTVLLGVAAFPSRLAELVARLRRTLSRSGGGHGPDTSGR